MEGGLIPLDRSSAGSVGTQLSVVNAWAYRSDALTSDRGAVSKT